MRCSPCAGRARSAGPRRWCVVPAVPDQSRATSRQHWREASHGKSQGGAGVTMTGVTDGQNIFWASRPFFGKSGNLISLGAARRPQQAHTGVAEKWFRMVPRSSVRGAAGSMHMAGRARKTGGRWRCSTAAASSTRPRAPPSSSTASTRLPVCAGSPLTIRNGRSRRSSSSGVSRHASRRRRRPPRPRPPPPMRRTR